MTRIAGACLSLLVATQAGAAAVTLKTSDPRLGQAFEWARRQALAYAFSRDPVGDWYEAALPGRQAFCMRDTAHQASGAHFLGLAAHNRNMLQKFAENISESKDWCSYWEINRDNLPAPVDYKDDANFWYNLPANFDVLDACYRMFIWTGDRTFLDNPIFREFYRRTVHDYVDRWDLSLDRIMTRPRIMNIRGHVDPVNRFQKNRGIPSYDEGNPNFVVAVDQLAAQYAGYSAYSRIAELQGDEKEAKEFRDLAIEVKSFLSRTWWDKQAENYYSRLNLEHHLQGHGLNLALLYYGAAEDGAKSAAVLNGILAQLNAKPSMGVEGQSHLPEILYRYGQPEAAYKQILDLTREDKSRREYPEVSYSVVGAIVTGLMGIEVASEEPGQALRNSMYVDGTVVTISRLTENTEWAEVDEVPVRANVIRVRHDGTQSTTLENLRGPSMMWAACFPASASQLLIEGKPTSTTHVERNGQALSCATLSVGSGEKKTARVVQ